MGIVDTSRALGAFNEKCKRKAPFQSPYIVQRETICQPAQHPFDGLQEEEIQYLLLTYGLFNPDAWRRAGKLVKKWKEGGLYEKLEKEYLYLKKMWNGPEVPVYLYPFQEGGSFLRESKENKGGVAFKEGLYLFYGDPVKEEDWKAVLAHEYNHVCRLTEKNVDMEHVTLLETLVIEGLGEYAVKEVYGKDYISPWTNQYTDKQLSKLWIDKFRGNLSNRERESQMDFLYGNKKRGLPRWSGYQIGYKIIESYHKAHPDQNLPRMMKLEADDLVKGSSFPLAESD
ncbi:DUF2268 domain-containing protein [Halobacillus sp. B29]|uniref:DUF2268 domain-containing protein n=1 Tax=Halobacillus sp. B29 TaxID=3457432 RepID=UPI003FCD9B8A